MEDFNKNVIPKGDITLFDQLSQTFNPHQGETGSDDDQDDELWSTADWRKEYHKTLTEIRDIAGDIRDEMRDITRKLLDKDIDDKD